MAQLSNLIVNGVTRLLSKLYVSDSVTAPNFIGKLTGTATKLGRNGDADTPMTFNWSGKDGQPTWLWGGENGSDMYVYNPSNFSVKNAKTAGSADSATKLSSSAGSATQPVYFNDGKPVAITYTLGKSVPADAKFTDTNTWRGVQNNLTSTATDQSLSAAQGKVLKDLIDGKAPTSHTHSQYYDSTISRTKGTVLAAPASANGVATFRTLTKSDVGLGSVDNTADSAKSVKYATSAGSATKATNDAKDQAITSYIRGLSVSGQTITFTKGDGTTGTITTQDTNTTYGAFKGATSSAAGGAGLVPAPGTSNVNQYLKGDGTWGTPSNTWRGIQNNLTSDSTNDSLAAAQGKALKALVDGKAASNHTHTKSQITDFPALGTAAAKNVRTLTAQGASGWKDAATDQKYVPDMSFIAYWNGAYSGTSSNLTYCNRGAFGTIVTKNTSDYAVAGHTHTWDSVTGKPSTFTPSSHTHGVIKSLSVNGTTITCTKDDGTTSTITTQDTNTTYGTFKGATTSEAGSTGLVIAPVAGNANRYLRSDGTWAVPANTWRGIQDNLTSTSTTDSLSANQGKVLKGLIDGKAASGHTHNYAGSSSAGGAATSANKVNAALTINLNGTSQGAWDGSSAKSISITAASVGATSVTISRW